MSVRWAIVGLGFVGGCAQFPDLVKIDALQGDGSVADLDPHAVDETVFEEELPVDVWFDLAFDETMNLPSARENVFIEDQEGVQLEVDLSARLQTLSVVPSEPLEPAQNHTLVIQAAIRDNSETSMISGYRIAFYTAD